MFTVPLTSLKLAAVAVLRLSGHLPSEGCSSYSMASTLGYTPNKEGESLKTGTTGQVTLRGKAGMTGGLCLCSLFSAKCMVGWRQNRGAPCFDIWDARSGLLSSLGS